MFNVGGGELLVIMLIALIVLGPQRLPDAARQVGRVMGDLRRISSGFQQELKDAFDDADTVTPARRKESMPLASTVAEIDRRLARPQAGDRGTATDAPAGTGETDPARELPPARDESTVAPAVAAALDEIVTPLDPPLAAPGDRAGAPAAEAAPPSDDDALGDERAAS